mmetsp:Transcript_58474/g.112846  ORF Transcript_58474/g.112846 Transcript_58474/m.112846 type:complete len:350 (+) Transcript_58474:396-1445(+)
MRAKTANLETIEEESAHYNCCFWRYKVQVFKIYHNPKVQVLVGALILSNFFVECVQRQIDPQAEQYKVAWQWIEDFFAVAFLLELLVNMYGSWCRPFFQMAWNYFDMFVVFIGILMLARTPLPGPFALVRMLRAFRVFRLFGRIASLRKILHSIELAIPGVMNAFVIMLIVVCIYAVLAVDLYSKYYTMVEPDTPGKTTARGEIFGEEYYGSFSRALYTLFQILTGESWAEMCVRPIFKESPNVGDNIVSAVFFISFVLICSVVLLNVVVAVLLDGMSTAGDVQAEELEAANSKEELAKGDVDNGIDDLAGKTMTRREEMAQMRARVQDMAADLREAHAAIKRLTERQG